MNKVWPFSLAFFFFSAAAFFAPQLVLYYQSLGFSGAQIGLLVGIGPLVTLVGAPLWTGFADRSGRHHLVMGTALLGASLSLFTLPLVTSYLAVLGVVILFSFMNSSVMAFNDAATMYMLGDQKELYGRVRTGGTLGFGLVAPVAGWLVGLTGVRTAFWGAAVIILIELAISRKLVFSGEEGRSVVLSKGSPLVSGARNFLSDTRWRVLLAMVFTGGLSVAIISYLFPYLKSLGGSDTQLGLLLTVGIVAELPTFYFGNQLLRRFKPYRLLLIAMGLTILRLVLLSVVNTPVLVLATQLINGLAFPMMWVSAVACADAFAPPRMRATAQGLLGATMNGIGTAVGGLTGGPLMEAVGGQGLFLIFAGVSVAVVLAAFLAGRRLPAGAMEVEVGAA